MEYCELPESWRQVLGALLGGSVAWQEPAELAGALGWEVEPTTDLLAALDEAGWLEIWEREEGPAVTLSALGAARLGVHLVEVGHDECPRWSPIGDPEPRPPAARGVYRDARAARFDDVIDPLPAPDVAAELAEAAGRLGSSAGRGPLRPDRWDGLPYPARLVGQGLTPWPGPARAGRPPCPACGGAELRADEYCLCCDRWGLDGRLWPATGPAARTRRDRDAVEAAQAAALRTRRKSRRHRRFHRSSTPPPAASARPVAGFVPLSQPPVGPRPACSV